MPAFTDVTLESLIEETLDVLYRSAERPAQVIVGSTAISDDNDTTLTLSTGTVDVTDRLEGGSEVMLVTGKSADADPVYTVSRGYLNTVKEAHSTGSVLLKGPEFHRALVERWVRKAVSSIMNTELPYLESATYARHATYSYIELPADSLGVFQVRHFGVLDGRVAGHGGWRFEELPTDLVASGKILRVSSGVTEDDELIVDVWRPYTFTGTGEAATVPLPVTATDVPVLWAAAYGMARREISKAEVDKIEEWNQGEAARQGVNLRMIRDMWGEVYRRVDESKDVHRLPKTRPFQKIAKVW
jgi:hypothetical protein